MAFTEGIIFEDFQQLFFLPMTNISEVLHTDEVSFERSTDQVQAIRYHRGTIPLLQLDRYFERNCQNTRDTLLVSRSSHGDFAIAIDRIHRADQVSIQPLKGPLRQIRGANGCVPLSCGAIALAPNTDQPYPG